jgi:hypothetical protein
MSKITQIDDRSAATAWSPVRAYADVIALGAKVSLFAGVTSIGFHSIVCYDRYLFNTLMDFLIFLYRIPGYGWCWFRRYGGG